MPFCARPVAGYCAGPLLGLVRVIPQTEKLLGRVGFDLVWSSVDGIVGRLVVRRHHVFDVVRPLRPILRALGFFVLIVWIARSITAKRLVSFLSPLVLCVIPGRQAVRQPQS